MPDPQAGKGQSSAVSHQWDPLAAFRARYPGVNEDDRTILGKLSNPTKFRSAFPEYSGVDDATIISNINKLRLGQPGGVNYPEAPAPPLGAVTRASRAFSQGMGADPDRSAGQLWSDLGQGLGQEFAHPIDSAKMILGADADARQRLIDQAYQDYRNPNHPISGKGEGLVRGAEGYVPFLGPALSTVTEPASRGDYATATGASGALLTQALFGRMAGDPGYRATVGDIVNQAKSAPSLATNLATRKLPPVLKDAVRGYLRTESPATPLDRPLVQSQGRVPSYSHQAVQSGGANFTQRPERPAPVWKQGTLEQDIQNARADRLNNQAQGDMLVSHVRDTPAPVREPQVIPPPSPTTDRIPLWRQAGVQPEPPYEPPTLNVQKSSPTDDIRSLTEAITKPVFQPEGRAILPDIRPGGDAPPAGLLPESTTTPQPISSFKPTARMYHGTNEARVPEILAEGSPGIKPREKYQSAMGPGPFVTGDPDVAADFGGRQMLSPLYDGSSTTSRTAVLSLDMPVERLQRPDSLAAETHGDATARIINGPIPVSQISGVSYDPPFELPPSPFEGITPSTGATSRLIDDIKTQSAAAQPGVLDSTTLPPLRRRTDVSSPDKLGPYIMPFDPTKE